jgi:hypothetical protein
MRELQTFSVDGEHIGRNIAAEHITFIGAKASQNGRRAVDLLALCWRIA